MMLQHALRPVQKSASRLLIAGANSAGATSATKEKPTPEAQPVGAVPGYSFVESGFVPASPSRLPAYDYAQQAVGPFCGWRQERLWPVAVQGWLGPSAPELPAEAGNASRPEPEPESPIAGLAEPNGTAAAQEASMSSSAQTPDLWHRNQRLPVGTMLCPVFWPVATFAVGACPEQSLPHKQGMQQQPPQPMRELSAAAQAAYEAGIQMPSRTAASRRQRRRQRATPPVAESAAPEASNDIPEALETLQRQTSAELASPGMLWPATPESTPPSSPRQREVSAAQAVNWGFPQMMPTAEMLKAEPDECEGLLLQLSEDAAMRPALLKQITGRMWSLASTPGGCRVVQKALEVAETSERVALAQRLQGHVQEACTSPHANHVLQRCIELMPPDRMEFVLTELKGHAIPAARHRYGCRVLERLIEHCSSGQTAPLVEEVLLGASQLCRHTFGNFVIQHILVHGMEEQRQRVAGVLCADIQRLARHRVASHVVRCALVHCSLEDRQRLALAMSADAGEFADLAHHHCGSFVVREMKRADGKRR
mmetsp:Transcript_31184/g.97011  ORF Transcript_31184/g.97011 Transcript_31184/m.97011 type:complete len:539 (-) Transcript_31184:110-1726(-)